jgi:hypothetical protein
MSKKMENALSILLAPTEQRIAQGAEYLRERAMEVSARMEAYIQATTDDKGTEYLVDPVIEGLLGENMFKLIRGAQEARRALLSYRADQDWAQVMDSETTVLHSEAPAPVTMSVSYLRKPSTPAARVVRDRIMTPVVQSASEDRGVLVISGHLVHHWPGLCAAALRVAETAGWDAASVRKFGNTLKATSSYAEAYGIIAKSGIVLRSEA